MAAADLSSKDIVLEIGPGLGILTRELAKKAKRVIAVEKDQRLIGILEKEFQGFGNIEVIRGDILKTNTGAYGLRAADYKIVANLPFYITAPVIRRFLEAEIPPKLMVLLIQKEVAQRICSKPPRMSILAVSAQFYADPRIMGYVPKSAFRPQPDVDGAILKILPRPKTHDRESIDTQTFFKIVKAGFSQPRKQLANNLAKKLGKERKEVEKWLRQNSIIPKQRAETLSIEDWVRLAKDYRS